MTSKVLLAGGCVLTLGARTPNHKQADVLIDGEVIAEVGTHLRARDAEQIDATGTIVMPGFVDTHRHAWTSLLRNAGERERARRPGRRRPPRLHGRRRLRLHADRAARRGRGRHHHRRRLVLRGTRRPRRGRAPGARGRRAFAPCSSTRRRRRQGGPPACGIGPARPRRSRSERSPRGSPRTEPPRRGRPPGSSACASTCTPTRTTPSRPRPNADSSATTSRSSTAPCSTTTDVDAIASSGAAISIAPASEMAGGSGSPPIQQLIDRDMRPGLGVDDVRVAPGDLFAQMRAAISMQHATVFDRKLAGKGGVPKLMTTRDVIRYATIDGARGRRAARRDRFTRAGHAGRRPRAADRPPQHLPDQRPDRRGRLGHGHLERRLGVRRRASADARAACSTRTCQRARSLATDGPAAHGRWIRSRSSARHREVTG